MSEQNQKQLPNPNGGLIQAPENLDSTTSSSTNSKDFMVGALIGTVIGAATALFLAPKAGKDLRNDVNTQATNLKVKTTEWKDTAVEKGNNFAEAAKDRTAVIKKSVQDSGIVDKVKNMRSKDEISEEAEAEIASSELAEPVGLDEDTLSQESTHDIEVSTTSNLEEISVDDEKKAVNQYDGSETNV
ncbi:YtxH domain-containing protein [Bacillus sp. 2205SS5-2]|uniref:YtxH domain-containing protein n=1 Tax=Bacillus sp. 2205SS5-2 TaxID=3109031 RepID=UPI0030064EF9